MAAKKAISKAIRVADWMTEAVLAVETFDSIAVARRHGEAPGQSVASAR